MAGLSPTADAPDYFLQPRAFPLLRSIGWAASAFAAEPDGEFLADVAYSTVNGYYYIRLLDNLIDAHGTVELKILPAAAFFHTEFQAAYQEYFPAAHPFWDVFRSAWFAGAEAVAHELTLDRIEPADFERVTVAKLAPARIPLAAVGFHYRAQDRLPCWEKFILALARWSQMEDDLFDWYDDLRHGKPSFFLTRAGRHPGFASVEAWVVGGGFQDGVETLQRELSTLRGLALPLNSPSVTYYLDCRESMLQQQKTKIDEAFQVLTEIASITEAKVPSSN